MANGALVVIAVSRLLLLLLPGTVVRHQGAEWRQIAFLEVIAAAIATINIDRVIVIEIRKLSLNVPNNFFFILIEIEYDVRRLVELVVVTRYIRTILTCTPNNGIIDIVLPYLRTFP